MMLFTQLSSATKRYSERAVAERLSMPWAVGSNSEAYSDDRERGGLRGRWRPRLSASLAIAMFAVNG